MRTTDSVTSEAIMAIATAITEREMRVYGERTRASQVATDRARKVLPAGVPSSFQAYDPHPIVVRHASGSRMIDVDGNEYVDYDMGFGALFAGHMHPAVRRAVEAQLDHGTLYVTPCELDAEVGELLADRYELPMWRPTNSGTEATMDAIRLARGVTKREKIVKVEGGFHGHHDEVMISNKPPLDKAGPADAPNSVPQSAGITQRHHRRRHRDPVQRSGRARAGAGERRRRLLHRRAGAWRTSGSASRCPAISKRSARSPRGTARC